MLLVLLSCKDEDPPRIVRERSPAVELGEQDLLFTIDGVYELDPGIAVEDFDQDGWVDLVVSLWGPPPENERLQTIVRGPLEPRAIPSSGGTYWTHEYALVFAAEVTGDGVLDMVLADTWIVPPSFNGHPLPGPGWLPLGAAGRSWVVDVDHDGTRDLVWDGWGNGDELHIIWGPHTRWNGPPDVIIGPLCRDGEVYGYPIGAEQAFFPGDLDSDGRPEAVMPAWGYMYDSQDCGAFTASLPEQGRLDPFDSPGVLDRFWDYDVQVLGDWTGDGLNELVYDGQILFSPVQLEGMQSAVQMWPVPDQIWAPSFDLGSDGQPDALILRDGVLRVVPATFESLAGSEDASSWELGREERVVTYLEQGHAYALVADPVASTIRRIDLGPASPL